jgi:hypothetical protein
MRPYDKERPICFVCQQKIGPHEKLIYSATFQKEVVKTKNTSWAQKKNTSWTQKDNSPVTKSPVTKSPVTKSPVTKSPVTKSPVTKSPPVTKTTTKKHNWFAHQTCVVCKECGTNASTTRFKCNLPYEIYPYGMKCECGCIYKNQAKIDLITCKVCLLKTSDVKLVNGELRHSTCTLKCGFCQKFGRDVNMTSLKSKKHNKVRNVHTSCLKAIEFKGDCVRCIHPTYDIDSWWPIVWTPKTHSKFPREFKSMVVALLMLRNRNEFPFPRDILYFIINLAKQPKDYKRQNGCKVDRMCLHTRCKNKILCKMCDSILCITSDEIETNSGCTSDRCQRYKFQCNKCDDLVIRGSSRHESCTEYRCIHDRCTECGQPIRPYFLEYSLEDKGCGKGLGFGSICVTVIDLTYDEKCQQMNSLVTLMGFSIVDWNSKNVLNDWEGLSVSQKNMNLRRFFYDNHESFTGDQLVQMASYMSVLLF